MTSKHISVLSVAVLSAISASAQITINPVAERSIGTPALAVTSLSPNLVEGRELYSPQAVAIDNSVSPARVYVSDLGNNRVLGWKNAASFSNGQKADIAIGQPDLLTTVPQGPNASGSNFSSGLTRPNGLAVDQSGNLYVADSGNNRVLRYPSPFNQNGQFPIPDLFLGQPTSSGHDANYPTGKVNPRGLQLVSGNSILLSSLAFDGAGNLWVIDPGNVRVVRFKASDLAGTGGGLSADLVLGQADLNSTLPALNSGDINSYYKLNQFVAPSGLNFDPSGNLYVSDASRVLVFPAPFTSGMSASSKIMGIFPSTYTYPTADADKQALLDKSLIGNPASVFFPSTGGVGVTDSLYSRIMIFDDFSKWVDGTPPAAKTILGQPGACTQSVNQTCKAANNGAPEPSDSVFAGPRGTAYLGTELFVVDSGNNRVVVLPASGSGLGSATRVLGQLSTNAGAINLVEGREFQFSANLGGSNFADASLAIDNSTGTPHLYVADTYNNRILGFRDMRKFQNGGTNRADLVIGQPNLSSTMANYPSGDPNKPTASSLYRPTGLLVDLQGNLYVADSLNGRVLRFPAPFAYAGLETKAGVTAGAAPEPADLVLGQQNFTTKIPDPTAAIMAIPYGLAFTPACNTLTLPCPAPNGLLVSDQQDNRILYIPTNSSGTFAAGTDNGKAATMVFGQDSFNTIATGTSLNRMNNPHHISTDTNGRVYVADTGNSRVLIFNDPKAAGTSPTGQPASAAITGLSGPQSVYASPVTGEIWVGNTSSGTLLRYANYESVLLGLGSISGIVDGSGNYGFHPLHLIQDQYGDLVLADDAHRVVFYYPGMNAKNGASFLGINVRPLAPLTIASIFPCDNCPGTQFGTMATAFSSYPVPLTLADVQVLVDGTPSPLYYVSGNQINFIVPNSAKTSGFADVQVVQASTGQILGAVQVPMFTVAPGAFLYPGNQTGATVYAAAINQDNTINDAAHPAPKGSVISLYMTGQGAIPGGPADGVQPTTAISGQYPVTVLLNGIDVNSPSYGESTTQHVLYAGINQYPGMWQVNVKIPNTVVTTSGVWFAVIANGALANWDATSGFRTYIYVK